MKIKCFLLVFIISACNSTRLDYQYASFVLYNSFPDNKEIKGYSYYRFNVEVFDSTSFDISLILDSTIRDGYKWAPKINDKVESNKIKYGVNWTKEPNIIQYSFFEGNLDSTNMFNFYDKKSYYIGDKKYNVYSIGHFGFEVDGDFVIFLNETYGQLATYSTSWDNLSILKLINKKTNHDLDYLIERLVQDSTFFPRPKLLNRDSKETLDRGKYYDTYEEKMMKSLNPK